MLQIVLQKSESFKAQTALRGEWKKVFTGLQNKYEVLKLWKKICCAPVSVVQSPLNSDNNQCHKTMEL